MALALGSVSGLAQAQAASARKQSVFQRGRRQRLPLPWHFPVAPEACAARRCDYADKSGFYVGAWASSIKWIKDAGGLRHRSKSIVRWLQRRCGRCAYDVGFLRYEYPSNKLAVSANTNEVYGAVTMGPVTEVLARTVQPVWFPNSKNSYYLDLSGTFDLGNGFSSGAACGLPVRQKQWRRYVHRLLPDAWAKTWVMACQPAPLWWALMQTKPCTTPRWQIHRQDRRGRRPEIRLLITTHKHTRSHHETGDRHHQTLQAGRSA
jgi:hypothetical protein